MTFVAVHPAVTRPISITAMLGSAACWGGAANWQQTGSNPVKEAHSLRLDSSMARQVLGWQPRSDLQQALQWTADWYRQHAEGRPAADISREQIRNFLDHDHSKYRISQ